MSGAAKNSTRAISHKDEIRDPDGDGVACEGVFDFQARIKTKLISCGYSLLSGPNFGTFRLKVFNIGVLFA